MVVSGGVGCVFVWLGSYCGCWYRCGCGRFCLGRNRYLDCRYCVLFGRFGVLLVAWYVWLVLCGVLLGVCIWF